MSYDDDDFLSGGGAPTISWANRTTGFKVKGKVLSIVRTQQTDLKTKEPKFWKDGNPMWQHVFTIQTDARNPEIEDDDGQRRLYVKGSRTPGSKSLADAINRAAQAANFKRQDEMIGADLEIEYLGTGVSSGPGLDPPNLFAATMVAGAPVQPVGANDLI